ncbi:MAG: HAMP domain-containing histidine kinase [Bryobacterales bacterium]|nr:HAMP domain-containing histidine kinase [Bryobacterales bacterium]
MAARNARRRNLAASFALIGLLGGAAGMLVRYTARSRRLAEMQFQFAAGVSHDLRTPLTAIRGAAFNLADGVVEPERVGSYARLILRNADELTAMIENVLSFSATLHRNALRRSDSFHVGDLLEHAAAAMAYEIERAGCKLELTLAPELPVLTGDSTALELAFRNLIANAVRHAAAGKWIGVSASAVASGVEIRISDRGPGIGESERERIFEAFYRGEGNPNGPVQGTGLGLSLVRSTVERHHGTVTVEDAALGGAEFIVRLPAGEASG